MDDVHRDFLDMRGKEGYSICKVCQVWKICHRTIYNWANKFPEFDEIFTTGNTYYRAWIDDTIRANLRNKEFNVLAFRLLAASAGMSDKPGDSLRTHPGFSKNPDELINKEYEEGKISSKTYKELQDGLSAATNRTEVRELRTIVDEMRAERKEISIPLQPALNTRPVPFPDTTHCPEEAEKE